MKDRRKVGRKEGRIAILSKGRTDGWVEEGMKQVKREELKRKK